MPLVDTDAILIEQAAHAAPSGLDQFGQAVKDYAQQLAARSFTCAQLEAESTPPDLVARHVSQGARAIAGIYGAPKAKTRWGITIGEYICVAALSVGASNIGDNWGFILFFASLLIGLALIVAHLVSERGA